MTRVNARTAAAAVAVIATATAAGLVLGATGASAGSSAATPGVAGAPATTAEEAQTVETCSYPLQQLKIGIRLTLRDEDDNDLKRIKVRVSNKTETGSFYRKGVTLKSLRIEVHQYDGDVGAVGIYRRTESPAYVPLAVKTTGAEVDQVKTFAKLRMPNGSTASATCSVSIVD